MRRYGRFRSVLFCYLDQVLELGVLALQNLPLPHRYDSRIAGVLLRLALLLDSFRIRTAHAAFIFDKFFDGLERLFNSKVRGGSLVIDQRRLLNFATEQSGR